MDNKNKWTKFCDDVNREIAEVKDIFKEDTLSIDENTFSKKPTTNCDKVTLDNIKNEIVGLLKPTEGSVDEQQVLNKIDLLTQMAVERDDLLKERKDEFTTIQQSINNKYSDARGKCLSVCGKLEKFTDDKLGVISVFSDMLQIVVDRDGFYIEKAKEKIKGLISKNRCDYGIRITLVAFAFILVLAVMIVSLYITFTKEGNSESGSFVFGTVLIAIVVVASLVGLFFLAFRIRNLVRDCCKIHQQLVLSQNKIEMHQMTIYEIDRELERIQEVDDK